MSTLSAQAVLQCWEQAQGEPALQRCLGLLRAAWPDVPAQQWGAMPLGARDGCLYTLQDALFGAELDTLVACPACSESLQLRFTTGDLRPPAVEQPADGPAQPALCCDGWELGYRLPCSDDLLELVDAGVATSQDAAARLLQRCLFQVCRDGQPAAMADLPPAVVDRLQREMAFRDPGADTRVALLCPACGHGFERRFDIGAYLWDELDDWAQRTLAEVHLLASAYGWSEPQTLALSAARRQHYIGLVQA